MRFGGSHIRSHIKSHARSLTRSHTISYARSHDHRFYDHGVTIAFLFGVSFDKQVIVKNYLQLDKKKTS